MPPTTHMHIYRASFAQMGFAYNAGVFGQEVETSSLKLGCEEMEKLFPLHTVMDHGGYTEGNTAAILGTSDPMFIYVI